MRVMTSRYRSWTILALILTMLVVERTFSGWIALTLMTVLVAVVLLVAWQQATTTRQ